MLTRDKFLSLSSLYLSRMLQPQHSENLSKLEKNKAARELGNDGNCQRPIARLSDNRKNWCAKQCKACDDIDGNIQSCKNKFCNSAIPAFNENIPRGCNRPKLSNKMRTWCRKTCAHCNSDVSFNLKHCSGTDPDKGRECCLPNRQNEDGTCRCDGTGENERGGVCVKTITRVSVEGRCADMEGQCGNFT
mmetsp:Transcript_19320/g.42040  ORF Transcript_19320/g.42040 Transcript_19320/m.42040 type:complete len:190 (+) Transcript_19320:315-884(+)